MRDKLGTVLNSGDYVLIAHNGPYLNVGCVQGVFVDSLGVEYLLALEVFQQDNDPSQALDTRPQTVKSSHKLVRIFPEYVPKDYMALLTPVSKGTKGHGGK